MSRRKKLYPSRLIFLEDGKIKKSNVNCLEKSGGKDRLPSGSVTTTCFFLLMLLYFVLMLSACFLF